MKLEFCEQCHRYHEHPALCGINFMKASEVSTPTQQELNVRFAKALGWIELEREGAVSRWPNWKWQFQEQTETWGSELPNYFAPENFHLVRAAVEKLNEKEYSKFANELAFLLHKGFHVSRLSAMMTGLLAPVEHIITAYLKVKEAN